MAVAAAPHMFVRDRQDGWLVRRDVMARGFNAPGVVKPFGIFSGAAWQPPGRVLYLSGQVSQAAAKLGIKVEEG